MKKRNLLAVVLLVFTMLITACGSKVSPFEGQWKGTCDLTDFIMDMMEEEYAEYMDYIQFENLSFVIDFTFEGDNVTMKVDEASVDEFVVNVETGFYNMVDQMMVDQMMKEYKTYFPEVETLDDVAALSEGEYEDGQAILNSIAEVYGCATYEEYLNSMVETANMGAMFDPLFETLNVSGTYEYNESTGILTIYYDNDTYEEMNFEFTGDDLVITVSDESVGFDIKCKKVTE